MKKKIKPCPLCGKLPYFTRRLWTINNDIDINLQCDCDMNCHSWLLYTCHNDSNSIKATENAIIRKWNKRTNNRGNQLLRNCPCCGAGVGLRVDNDKQIYITCYECNFRFSLNPSTTGIDDLLEYMLNKWNCKEKEKNNG